MIHCFCPLSQCLEINFWTTQRTSFCRQSIASQARYVCKRPSSRVYARKSAEAQGPRVVLLADQQK